MSNDKETILSARNIHKTYTIGRTKQHVLQGVNLTVARGEFLAVTGASGSGKSTLLHILGLLDYPDKGRVFFEERNLFDLSATQQNRIRGRQIGFVFQFYHLLPELTLEENVLLPLMVDSSVWSWPGRRHRDREQVRQVIASVDLTDQAHQLPATLSGGQRQRAALARALVRKPTMLLADEPTGNLDSAAGRAVLELLMQLNRAGQTIIMVTHDTAIAEMADRKILLQDGKIG